jgi:hypothetical protein
MPEKKRRKRKGKPNERCRDDERTRAMSFGYRRLALARE